MIRLPETTLRSQRNAFRLTTVAAAVFLVAIVYSGCMYVVFRKALPVSQDTMYRLAESLQRQDWHTAASIADDPAAKFSGVRDYRHLVAEYGPVLSWRMQQDDSEYSPTGFAGYAEQRYAVRMARGIVTVVMSTTPGETAPRRVRFLGALSPNESMRTAYMFSIRL